MGRRSIFDMNRVSNFFSQKVSVCGNCFNLGQSAFRATALVLDTTYACKRVWASSKTLPLSEKRFWQKVKEVPTITQKDGPIVVRGVEMFPSLSAAKREIFLSCTHRSEYVKTYLIQSDLKGTVLDLGCGVGANSIPLFRKGWKVVALDSDPEIMAVYSATTIRAIVVDKILSGYKSSIPIIGDIVTSKYPENVDAVICVDVLPYITPEHLKVTIDKIFGSLRPGGQFVGTLFFQSNIEKDPFFELMGKLGAHFCPGKEFAREIITRSGFQIKAQREMIEGLSYPHIWEFLAIRPE